MKSVLYLLIALFVSSIVFSAIPKSKLGKSETVTLQCVEDHCPRDLLTQSATIVKTRLVNYGLRPVNVMVNPDQNEIVVQSNKRLNVDELSFLFATKGQIAFYETLNKKEIIEKLPDDSELHTLLNISGKENSLTNNAAVLGTCKAGNRQKVEDYLQVHYVSHPEGGIQFLWSHKADNQGNYSLYLIKKQPVLDKSNIQVASVSDNASQNVELYLRFNEASAQVWENITKANLNKAIAVVLDGQVLQAPVVKTVIEGGNCAISGQFTKNELLKISAIINSAELPLTLRAKR